MVELGGVSHTGFYRFDADRRPPSDADMDLRGRHPADRAGTAPLRSAEDYG
jgi:hypothetical protein